ncbi:MAG TPA: hypothetical protein VN764_12730 [Polyangiaceae bacterium]|nr:hypothetical protein [Polyangiaceae bacterium]
MAWIRGSVLSSSFFTVLVASALGCSGGAPEPLGVPFGSGGSSHSGGAPQGSGGTSMSGGAAGSGGQSTGSGGGAQGGAPALLSETGLFAEGAVLNEDAPLAESVRSYTPRFELWSDGAAKRRWIYLPPGEHIDTSDMDYWEFPSGTKLWKEFSRDGVRVETRLLEKSKSGSWSMMAYVWRSDLSDADAVPDGRKNAAGTEHDVPSSVLCAECHARMPDRVLGFSAVQLSAPGRDAQDLNLDELVSQNILSDPPGTITLGGTPTDQNALGYLHANCGHCHHPKSSVAGQVPMYLWLTVQDLQAGDLAQTQSYLSTVNVELTKGSTPAGTTHRVVPGSLEQSALYERMTSRGQDYSMPPLGTEQTDSEGMRLVADWINALLP